MHSKVYIYRVICPECGNVQYGFVGDNEDGSFHCEEEIEIIKGKRRYTEICGFYSEKIHHLEENNYRLIKTISLKDFEQDFNK